MSVLGNWSLDISIRAVLIARDPDACEDVVYVLQHYSLKPVASLQAVPNEYLGGDNAFLATEERALIQV